MRRRIPLLFSALHFTEPLRRVAAGPPRSDGYATVDGTRPRLVSCRFPAGHFSKAIFFQRSKAYFDGFRNY